MIKNCNVIFDNNSSHGTMSFFLMIHFAAILVLQSCGKLKWAVMINSNVMVITSCKLFLIFMKAMF